MGEIILSTSKTINGKYPKKTLGLVRGNTARMGYFGMDIATGLRNLVRGEIKTYTQLIASSRDEALARMKEEPREFGANGIIMIRSSLGEVMPRTSGILAFGTDVVV